MGLPTFARAHLKSTYLGAFSFTCKAAPTVCVYDLMKDVKYMPDTVTTMEDVLVYLVNKIKTVLVKAGSTIKIIVVCVDRKPPPVKRMVTHGKRYKDKDVFMTKEGPYLPIQNKDLVPNPWIRFAGNYKLLQRELYPRLFNAFMDGIHIVPKPGQMIILHGFPGYMEYVTIYKQQAYSMGTNKQGQVKEVHIWKSATELPLTRERERSDPDLYNRIYVIENVEPCPQFPSGYMRREEWEEAKNDISESDGAMFYYDHWFPNQTILFICNDGDIFAYGLLYAYERATLTNTYRNTHIGCLPYKKTQGNEIFGDGQVPAYEYVDFNILYSLVKDDASMLAAGVQNNVLTLVFLLIMAESDFFKGAMKGLGAENVVWKTFFSSLKTYSHMVQMSKSVVPSTRTPRVIILDEDLFRIFVHNCYLAKYEKATRKRFKLKDDQDITYDQLAIQCASGKKAQKDEEYKMPERNKVRLWARQVEWNLLYYKNTPFGNQYSPNPFEMWDGLPYYPYVKNPETGKSEMSTVVSATRKPIDEVFTRHMYAHRRRTSSGGGGASESKKRELVKTFDK